MKKNYEGVLVTIVTVTYNAEDLLEVTINSVINQRYANIEYIVIDGASTDKTVDIIKKYEDRIDYWISEPDEGIYYAMNKAIEKASGSYINFMNAGDIFASSDTVEYVMSNKHTNADLIYGDHIRENPYRIVKAQARNSWYSTVPFCHQTLFVRVDIMKVTMFDTHYKLAADHDFIIKMLEAKKEFQYLEKTLAVYAEGGFSQTEPLFASIESLNILLHSKASQNEIEASWWFKLLKENICVDHPRKMAELRSAFKDLASIKFLFHPIEKIKKYKIFMIVSSSFLK